VRDDDLLADRVDRRVGHLGEELLEIIVEQARLVGEHRERGVVAHGADGLDAVLGHRGDDDALVLKGVAEGELALEERGVIGRLDGRRLGEVAEVDEVLLDPLLVRLGARNGALDLLVLDDAALDGVHEEHAARLQAALLDDVLGREVQHAGFGSHDDDAVLRDVVARRAQAVAVEDGADLGAVGETHGGGAVPRLHEAGVILVERAALRVHRLVVGPRLGDEHHHRVRQRAAGEHEQLEGVVEHRRVGTVGVHDRENLLDVVAEDGALEQRLAGVHPVDVAAEGVDLAVVREIAVGMRAFPAGEGVRREARVDQREGRLHRGVLQVGKIVIHLVGGEHALVDERARREAGDIPGLGTRERRGANDRVGALADDVELPLEAQLVEAIGAGDEALAHERLGGLRGVTE
jgi:hypothetical protein